ncbi:MAG: hypothetical protein IK142_07940 [Clostridiales bacterium]|nr:hypothetical protein [Clostridiales bacterium]
MSEDKMLNLEELESVAGGERISLKTYIKSVEEMEASEICTGALKIVSDCKTTGRTVFNAVVEIRQLATASNISIFGSVVEKFVDKYWNSF